MRIKIPQDIKEFFFDGCHKIFLIENKKQKIEMLTKKGWEKTDIYPIAMIQERYDRSCILKAVWFCDTDKDPLVRQCEKRRPTFVIEGR